MFSERIYLFKIEQHMGQISQMNKIFLNLREAMICIWAPIRLNFKMALELVVIIHIPIKMLGTPGVHLCS